MPLAMFSMDNDDEWSTSLPHVHKMRETSLTRGYEALGVELHRLDDGSDTEIEHSTPMALQAQPSHPQSPAYLPPVKPPQRKAVTLLPSPAHSRGFSAMSLDVGGHGRPGSMEITNQASDRAWRSFSQESGHKHSVLLQKMGQPSKSFLPPLAGVSHKASPIPGAVSMDSVIWGVAPVSDPDDGIKRNLVF